MQNLTALKIYLLVLSCVGFIAAPPQASAQDKSWQTAFGDVNELLPDLREEIVKIPQTQKLANAKPGDKPLDRTATLFQPPG
jgi:hypothetical protein